MSDINERQYWDRYQELYEDMIEHTSTDYAPGILFLPIINGTAGIQLPKLCFRH